jgi:formate dehydrogenase gamma subunit
MWKRRFTVCCLLLAGLPLIVPSLSAAEPIKDSACMDCHEDKELWKTNSSGRAIHLFVDAAKLKASSHKTNACVSCHADVTSRHPDDNVAVKSVSCARCHAEQSETYGASVHALALGNGGPGAALCQDCHDSHGVLPPTSPASPLHYSRLAETCGGCHEQEALDMAASVHGKALAAGYREAPTCTDCHSEHEIHGLKGSTPKLSAETCSACHASERLNTKFKLPADRVRTFFDSYHGLAAQYGSMVAANCGSCHGAHKVLRSTDPQSTIHPSNLAKTCGVCHPGASENFVQSKVHVDPAQTAAANDVGASINFWVRRIYLLLIFGTIGAMLLHNGMVFFRKMQVRCANAHLVILRMNVSQRTQHAVLAISFILLAITGFALKFPDSWVSKLMGSHEGFRSWSHRVAGVVLLLAGAYHIWYIIATREGRKLIWDLAPTPKDLRDITDNARFLAGLRKEKAKIGRFGYAEKMEYWAVVWGTVIMGVTGFMIWFKIDVTRFLPRWAVDVATTIHYYEAILACLAIIVWHFYHVIFDPDVYPINWAAWNGKVSRHWQEDEHPLEEGVVVVPEREPKPGESKPKTPSAHA